MQIQSSPISPDKQALLSKWLEEPAFDILIEVLESGRFDVQIKAANDREHAVGSGHEVNAVALDERARELSRIISTLQAMKQQKAPFTTSSAIP